jgi:hypothetical protein
VSYQRKPDQQFPGGLYAVPQANGVPVRRPNKLAAGMTYTFNRTKKIRRPDGIEPLDSMGRTDLLHLITKGWPTGSPGLLFKTSRVACPCCGHKAAGKLRLNEAGKMRLKHLRRMLARRKEVRA